MPNPSTPTLLLIVFRSLTPLSTSARMRFSGMPQRPKPPIIMVAPSGMSPTAWSELAITLFTDEIVKQRQPQGTEPEKPGIYFFLARFFAVVDRGGEFLSL